MRPGLSTRLIARYARRALLIELETWPKPGLVGPFDSGSHHDMSAALLRRSAEALWPFFIDLADAGRHGASFIRLQQIGIAAESAMLEATNGVNTHRGALFGLGLLCAAAGAGAGAMRLGQHVRVAWGRDIRAAAPAMATTYGAQEASMSHGARIFSRFGLGGARAEAARGFPHVFAVGVPALTTGTRLARADDNAARVHACIALIAAVNDTNLVHRGGLSGLLFAQSTASQFIAGGGVGVPDWYTRALAVHRSFVERRLSPGGSADLLAMSLLVRLLRGQDDARVTDMRMGLQDPAKQIDSPSD